MALDFAYKEYYNSSAADKNKINNKPGVDESLDPAFSEANIKNNLEKLHYNVIDPIRKAFPPYTNGSNKDIWITSGYRCEALNSGPKGIKPAGATNSQHRYGYAVDIISIKSRASLIFNWCYQNLPEWNQMIWEFPEKGDWVDGTKSPAWVHISYVEGNNRKGCSLASKREDLHEIYKTEFTTRSGVYTHGITLADQNLI